MLRRMKSLFLTNEYPPTIYGGAGVHVDYLSRELAKLIDVEVRCYGKKMRERRLDLPIHVADARFAGLRRRYEIQLIRPTVSGSWWEECIWGTLEPTEFRVVDKMTGQPAGRAVHWDLEGFSWKWNMPAAGLFDVEIRAHLRKQGLAKFLLASILKLLQDQFFAMAELQVWADDPAGMGICKSLGFEQVDIGYRYRAIADRPAQA